MSPDGTGIVCTSCGQEMKFWGPERIVACAFVRCEKWGKDGEGRDIVGTGPQSDVLRKLETNVKRSMKDDHLPMMERLLALWTRTLLQEMLHAEVDNLYIAKRLVELERRAPEVMSVISACMRFYEFHGMEGLEEQTRLGLEDRLRDLNPLSDDVGIGTPLELAERILQIVEGPK